MEKLKNETVTMQISSWYKHEKMDKVTKAVESILDDCGFNINFRKECGMFLTSGEDHFSCISEGSEDHVVFELVMRRVPKDYLLTFIELFNKLIENEEIVPNECMLTDNCMDIYPFYTHSFTRGSAPISIEVFENQGTKSTVYNPGDKEYWSVNGPQLHFLSDRLYQTQEVPEPSKFAEKMLAKHEKRACGVVFDCGWSEQRVS